MGALYAAVNVLAATAEPETRTRAVQDLTTGPGRDRALEEPEAEPPEDSSPPELTVQVAGFDFLTYDGEVAVTDMALRASNGRFVHLVLVLRWEDGDWRLSVPHGGNAYDSIRPLRDLEGFVPWSGA
ncbi:hypothetical protein [Thalassiella azotivora]